MKISRSDLMARAAALVIPVLYVCLYTPYGMDTTDFGYFYGYSWRILQGQIPYRDFYYIKPSLPLYWHALWMLLTPDNIEVLAGKIGFVASMLVSSWLAAAYLKKYFNLEELGLSLPLLATCGFVWGVHCFPHMPWHTVDGVLFSACALLLAAEKKNFCAGLFAAFAMLCKQSFLFVPFAVTVLAFLAFASRREAVKCVSGVLAVLLAYYLFLCFFDAWKPFTRLTTGQLAIEEALDAGVLIYLRQNWLIPAAACLPWIISLVRKKSLSRLLHPCPLYLFIITCYCLYLTYEKKAWIGFGASWPTLFMVLGGICVLFPRKFLAPWQKTPVNRWGILLSSASLGAALLVSWSVAISGGYKIPAFFAVPLLFSFFLVHKALGGSVRIIAWATLAAGLAIFSQAYQFPYVFPERPLKHSDMTFDAGGVYPRCNGVIVDREMYEKLEELRQLRNKYGSAYKTLPGFTLAYYLNGDYPVFGSDWLIDWEINAEVGPLYQDLLDKNLTVFMEKDQMDAERADAYDRAGYTLPQLVRHNWRMVDETEHFAVFKPPLQGR